MRSNYKRLGKYIEVVNVRNTKLEGEVLLGVSIKKILMPSIANTIGTDMSTYKIIGKKQFAYGPVTSRNGNKISVALLEDNDAAIVSQAYTVFEITDHTELDPEYLMMWFRRQEFDRYARFKSHGSAREIFDWDEMCDTELPIPSIEKQHEIVKEYNAIVNRIKLNEQINQKLEETAQAIYKHWFEKWEREYLQDLPLNELCSLITDGKHGDCKNELESGYYFVSAKDLVNGQIDYSDVRQITESDFEETHRRTQFSEGDILITNSGTIGRMAIGKNLTETGRTTFQKSVAILKPKKDFAESHYLYCILKSRINDIRKLASGTSQSNLLLGDLRSFEIRYPGYNQVSKFEGQTKIFFEHQHYGVQENKWLKQLKDLVLAKMTKVD